MNEVLNRKIYKLNVLKGRPVSTYNKDGVANIGNYHLEGAYGEVRIAEITTEGGGIKVISNYSTKKELSSILDVLLNVCLNLKKVLRFPKIALSLNQK